jgi:hypothetical protein
MAGKGKLRHLRQQPAWHDEPVHALGLVDACENTEPYSSDIKPKRNPECRLVLAYDQIFLTRADTDFVSPANPARNGLFLDQGGAEHAAVSVSGGLKGRF